MSKWLYVSFPIVHLIEALYGFLFFDHLFELCRLMSCSPLNSYVRLSAVWCVLESHHLMMLTCKIFDISVLHTPAMCSENVVHSAATQTMPCVLRRERRASYGAFRKHSSANRQLSSLKHKLIHEIVPAL